MAFKYYIVNTSSYKHFKMCRTALYALLMAFSLNFLLHSNVHAQEDMQEAAVEVEADPYLIENIEVDVTADNAVEARSKAFEAAQIKGYKMLGEKLLSQDEFAALGEPDIGTVSSFVENFEVTNEKLSAVRYKGVYKIRYSARAFRKANPTIQNALNNNTQEKSDILVLPFYEINGQTLLWQQNPFLDAWMRARNNNEAGRAIVPAGDYSDVDLIQNNQALNYSSDGMNRIAGRYGAKAVAILVATPEAMNDGTTNIVVRLYNAKPYGPELARQFSVRGYPGELQEQRYGRVVTTAKSALNQQWQRQTAIQNVNLKPQVSQAPEPTGPVVSLTAQMNFNSAREWVEMKKAIESLRLVHSVDVQSLSPRNATLKINHQGSVDALRNALQSKGVGLNSPAYSNTPAINSGDVVYQIYGTPKTSMNLFSGVKRNN